ncbi:MAG: oxygenase MpaB family protein [Pseudomonadota bacterium]
MVNAETPIRNVIRAAVFGPVERHLDVEARKFLGASSPRAPNFAEPAGEPALSPPDSMSWRVFKNPACLFIGGVAAVLLELAEPRVREGVWRHSSFRRDPVGRLRRTGLAAMITVYGPRSVAEAMIAKVNAMHAHVRGVTPGGEAYAGDDPELLDWVQATASFGFLEAYAAYAAPLSDEEKDRFYRESGRAAALYGAAGAPRSLAEQRAYFAHMTSRLEGSDIIEEFIGIMRHAPALPPHLRLSQRVFVRAAIDILPPDVRARLGLEGRGLRPFEDVIVRRVARRADRLCLRSCPAAKACERLGLPADYLFNRERELERAAAAA